jgi:hypothetical protein
VAPAYRAAFVGCLVVAAFAQASVIDSRPVYLAGMERPVQAILNAKPTARIFYAGPCDSAFVFYLRKADEQRRARVFRATVQAEDPKDFRTFLERQKVDFIVFEDTQQQVEAQMPEHTRFREEVRTAVTEVPGIAHLADFDLPYGRPGLETNIRLRVYSRFGPGSQAAAK